MAKAVTLKMIADKVGVSKSTVSDVLRSRVAKVKVSDSTKEKIFQAVKELNYEPNAAARALVTGKTHNIGFLLSSKTNHGLANNYFSSIMSGVQCASIKRGYNCFVNCYDLSSVKEFVMPSKFRRRVVDGLIISGRIEEQILQMFIDSGLPFILVGENADFPVEGILSVARNLSIDWLTTFEYLYEQGHRHIAVGGIETHLGFERYENAVKEYRSKYPDRDIEFSTYSCIDESCAVMDVAYRQGSDWKTAAGHPTAVVGHDQWCVGFMSGVIDAGYNCPDDISVVSSCDTTLCKWFRPAITAMGLPLYEGGMAAAEVLIDYIERKTNWVEANRRAATIWNDHELIVRESTGKACS